MCWSAVSGLEVESVVQEWGMSFLRVAAFSLFSLLSGSGAYAEGCNVADVLFGKVRIELIQHRDYQTGVIYGNDFDSKRFSYYRILGQIMSPERDGSRRISDVNGEVCGVLLDNMTIDTSDSVAPSGNISAKVQRISSVALVVLHGDGGIAGTITGRLPK